MFLNDTEALQDKRVKGVAAPPSYTVSIVASWCRRPDPGVQLLLRTHTIVKHQEMI